MYRTTGRLYKTFLQIRKRHPLLQTDAASHLVMWLVKWSPRTISTQSYTTVHGSTGLINTTLTLKKSQTVSQKTFKERCPLNFVLVGFYSTVYHSNPRQYLTA